MTMEPLMGPIIRRRYMNCAPPPLRREPRMETDGSAAGGTSILNSQLSNLYPAFSPGTFFHCPTLYSWRRKGRKEFLRFPGAQNPWNRERREDFFI